MAQSAAVAGARASLCDAGRKAVTVATSRNPAWKENGGLFYLFRHMDVVEVLLSRFGLHGSAFGCRRQLLASLRRLSIEEKKCGVDPFRRWCVASRSGVKDFPALFRTFQLDVFGKSCRFRNDGLSFDYGVLKYRIRNPVGHCSVAGFGKVHEVTIEGGNLSQVI